MLRSLRRWRPAVIAAGVLVVFLGGATVLVWTIISPPGSGTAFDGVWHRTDDEHAIMTVTSAGTTITCTFENETTGKKTVVTTAFFPLATNPQVDAVVPVAVLPPAVRRHGGPAMRVDVTFELAPNTTHLDLFPANSKAARLGQAGPLASYDREIRLSWFSASLTIAAFLLTVAAYYATRSRLEMSRREKALLTLVIVAAVLLAWGLVAARSILVILAWGPVFACWVILITRVIGPEMATVEKGTGLLTSGEARREFLAELAAQDSQAERGEALTGVLDDIERERGSK